MAIEEILQMKSTDSTLLLSAVPPIDNVYVRVPYKAGSDSEIMSWSFVMLTPLANRPVALSITVLAYMSPQFVVIGLSVTEVTGETWRTTCCGGRAVVEKEIGVHVVVTTLTVRVAAKVN